MITSYCQYALKEWSVTVDSLLAGRQILLLRQGGIREQRDGFKVEHPKFVLFPTHLQQGLQALHPSFQPDLVEPGSSRTSTVILNTFVLVQELIPISDLKALRTVGGMHTLSGFGLIRRRKAADHQKAAVCATRSYDRLADGFFMPLPGATTDENDCSSSHSSSSLALFADEHEDENNF